MIMYTQYIQGLLSVQAQYSTSCPSFSISSYNGCLVTWTVVCLPAAKFKPLYISCVGLRLVQRCEHLQFHDFVWLLLVVCIKPMLSNLGLPGSGSLILFCEQANGTDKISSSFPNIHIENWSACYLLLVGFLFRLFWRLTLNGLHGVMFFITSAVRTSNPVITI
jgi:hypothetical protein